MSIPQPQDVVPYIIGGAGVTNFVWLDWLQPGYQIVLGFLGLVVLVLTIRNKLLEIKIKQNILREKE